MRANSLEIFIGVLLCSLLMEIPKALVRNHRYLSYGSVPFPSLVFYDFSHQFVVP